MGWMQIMCANIKSLKSFVPIIALIIIVIKGRTLFGDFKLSNISQFEQLPLSLSNVPCSCSRPLPPVGKDFSSLILQGKSPPDGSYVGRSSCNTYTDRLGAGQNVMSYSYYTPGNIVHRTKGVEKNRHWFRYLGLVDDLLKDLLKLYPVWRMRIYHNVTSEQPDQQDFLCKLHCKYSYLDLCDVREIPELAEHADLETKIDLGRAWRFIVLGDPTVKMFGVRDLDMYMLPRERDAMRDWEIGSKQFYLMRDTPQGRNRAGFMMPMKGGCWGGDNYFDFDLAQKIRMNHTTTRTIVTPSLVKTYSRPYFSEFFDMVYLRHLVWPVIKSKSNIYDSYNCQKHKELGVGRPFPSKRHGNLYVGCGPTKTEVIKRLKSVMCPVACRPRNHRDWLYC